MPTQAKLEAEAHKILLRKEALYAKDVQEVLLDSLNTMRGQMTVIYNKYAVDGKLTLAQMTQYNRYATMEKQMLDTMKPAIRANLATMKRLTPEQYQAAFFHYAYPMDVANQVRLSYGVLNMNTVIGNLANPWTNIALTDYPLNNKRQIRVALNTGLAQGKSYQQMSRDLLRATDITYNQALRIIRTEGQSAANAGQDDLYIKAQQQGIEGNVIWDSTLDGKTRPSKKGQKGDHRVMDQQVKKNGLFQLRKTGETAPYPAWSGLSAAQRIHCRCHERFEVEGYEPQLRASRDQGLVPFQSYSEWEKNAKITVR